MSPYFSHSVIYLMIFFISILISFESAEEVFRITADIVTMRAKQNHEEVSSRWEPLFNNLGQCCRKNKKYKESLEYHQYVSIICYLKYI